MLVGYFNCMSHYVDFNACFFRGDFSANAALTFQIGLNDCARAIQGKFMFAGAWESFQRIRAQYIKALKVIAKVKVFGYAADADGGAMTLASQTFVQAG